MSTARLQQTRRHRLFAGNRIARFLGLLHLRSGQVRYQFLAIALALFGCLFTTSALARAGGGVSVGRSAPSMARSVPSYSPPPPRPSYTPPPRYVAPYTPPVVVHQSTGGGFGSSFFGSMTGSMVGNALSRPDATVPMGAPAVVETAPPGATVAAAPAQVIVERESGFSWGWFWFAVLLCAGAVAWAWWPVAWAWWRLRDSWRADRGTALFTSVERAHAYEEFDPLMFFYCVQQASMDDNGAALSTLCTPGMTEALSGSPEPNRVARKTLTGVSYKRRGSSITYRFTDEVERRKVIEHWQFTPSIRLEGIEVASSHAVTE